jgi:hypothetical protein
MRVATQDLPVEKNDHARRAPEGRPSFLFGLNTDRF